MSVRAAGGLLLMALAGCTGFSAPAPETLSGLPPAGPPAVRWRAALDLDSERLSGAFEAVVVAERTPRLRLRAQLFPDLGPKAVDLWASPDRIAGHFAVIREGVDCRLPGEAALHPLLLFGVTMLELAAPVGEDRIQGELRTAEGVELALRGAAPGVDVVAVLDPVRGIVSRRFRWLWGASWEWRRTSDAESEVTAPGLRARIRVLESKALNRVDPGLLEPALPADVDLKAGTRRRREGP